MIDKIDSRILRLLEIRDSEYVMKYPQLRASICNLIEKCYLLQRLIISNKKFYEDDKNQFFSAPVAVIRHFRDWKLDEVVDIYIEMRHLAKDYVT